MKFDLIKPRRNPNPGDILRWRFLRDPVPEISRWHMGIVSLDGDAMWTDLDELVLLCDVEFEIARILKPGEIAVRVI